MLRHTGQKRSFKHNLQLATLLSLNAGFINAAGFIAFQVLTTNVTGHAALLAVNIASSQFRSARMVALWLLLFLAGAFSSGLMISKVGRDKPAAYTTPILLIIGIIFFVAVFGQHYRHTLPETEYFAGSLLFAMGMQNALVSMISGSVVRTTHLTGMFTDLGIDFSILVTSPRASVKAPVRNRIILRITIILFFLSGGVFGGLMFTNLSFRAFFVPVLILIIALFYDYFRIKLRRVFHYSKLDY
jgi:uncharacterized membrane protein YoaK (UPF0700 family)